MKNLAAWAYNTGVKAVQEGKALVRIESAHPVRNWAVGSMVGGVAVGFCAYNIIRDIQEVIADRAPGNVVDGLGYAVAALAISGATKEAFDTFRQRYEAASWHEAEVIKEQVSQ